MMSASSMLAAFRPLTTSTTTAGGSISLEWMAIGLLGMTLTAFLVWYFLLRKSGSSE